MSGVVIRRDYYLGMDYFWEYLQQTPYSGAWGWVGSPDMATVIAPTVAQRMAPWLQLQYPDSTIRVLQDYYQRQPTVTELPNAFRTAA